MLQSRIAVLTVFVVGIVFAQSEANKGGINGSVVDPNAAVVPNVKVTATNPATGSTRVTNTNAAGEFGSTRWIRGHTR